MTWSRELAAGRNLKTEGLDSREITKMLQEGYEAHMREPDKIVDKQSFAPSSIGYDGNGRCPRYWYMAFEGKYKGDDTSDLMGMATMVNGRFSGQRIAEVFEKAGTLVAAEVEAKLVDPPVRGYIDVLVRLESGEVAVGEIKTTRDGIFMHRKTTMKPLPYHLYQILIYMKATGKKNGFLMYENRDDLTFLIIPVAMDENNEKILEEALEWMRKVRKNWEAEGDTLPKRPFTKSSKQCKYCPLKRACWNEAPEGTVVIEPMEVAEV
jgi:CRISPR/Cas system-associated exonuclease Cas4 (RecB family)